MAFLTRAAAESFLVLFDAWSKGWEVTVDGARERVLRAERLAAGTHRVVFSYHPPGVRDGLLLGLLGILLLAAVAVRKDAVKSAANGAVNGAAPPARE